jgi:uroporphyrinogen-III decarboxylase
MMTMDERKQRWRDFYTGKYRTMILIEQDYGIRPFPSPETMDAFFAWSLNKYHIQRESLEWLDDDRIPYVTVLMGTDIFAHAFGCPVVFPGNNNPFAQPIIFNAGELAKLKPPKLENSSLMEVFEFGQKLRRAAPEALIQLPDIQSPLDIAALIWEKADFFMAMYDDPQAVKDLIAMSYTLLTDFLDLWFSTFGAEFIAHFPDYYMPWGITLSEDEIGSLSEALCREFSLPTLIELSAHFGSRIGIHCCANAKHQWPVIKTIPGLVLLNLIQPDKIIQEASVYCGEDPPLMVLHHQNELLDHRSRAVLWGIGNTKAEILRELERLKELAALFR